MAQSEVPKKNMMNSSHFILFESFSDRTPTAEYELTNIESNGSKGRGPTNTICFRKLKTNHFVL